MRTSGGAGPSVTQMSRVHAIERSEQIVATVDENRSALLNHLQRRRLRERVDGINSGESQRTHR